MPASGCARTDHGLRPRRLAEPLAPADRVLRGQHRRSAHAHRPGRRLRPQRLAALRVSAERHRGSGGVRPVPVLLHLGLTGRRRRVGGGQAREVADGRSPVEGLAVSPVFRVRRPASRPKRTSDGGNRRCGECCRPEDGGANRSGKQIQPPPPAPGGPLGILVHPQGGDGRATDGGEADQRAGFKVGVFKQTTLKSHRIDEFLKKQCLAWL